MKTPLLLAAILSALTVPPTAMAGFFDNIVQQTKQSLQQTVDSAKNAASNTTNNIENQTTNSANQKVQNATGSVNNRINNATGSFDNRATNATSNLENRVNNAPTTMQSSSRGLAAAQSPSSVASTFGTAINRRGAYGPDMVGVRLGMTMNQAESVVRRHMQVGWVGSLKPAFLKRFASKDVRGVPKVFVARNEREVIILLSHPKANNRVLGVQRLLKFPGQGIDPSALKKKLKAKYGPTSVPNALIWGGGRKCIARWTPLAVGAFTFVDANNPSRTTTSLNTSLNSSMLLTVALMKSLLVQSVPLQMRVRLGVDGHQCGPLLQAAVSSNSVDLILADRGWLYDIFDKANARAIVPPKATTASDVQF